MDRRNFLFAAAGTLAFGAHASEVPDAYAAAFEASRASQPWTLGYAGLQQDAAPMPLKLRGKIPSALYGAYFRNGPARHEIGGQRYHHLFDGDGMVQKYTIGPDGVSHMGRFVRTQKFLADSAAGRPVRAAFGTHPPGAEPMHSPDAINAANTSVLQHGGEFYALWEGGSATRMDPRTLDTGELKTWSPEYAGMPFSAHPKVEPDGTLWNFGVSSMAGLLSVYRIDARGALQNAVTLKVPEMSLVHDFAVTQKYLVFLLPPLVFDRARSEAGETFLDSHVWKPQLGMRVLVLDKDKLEEPQWFTLPAGFVFHIGNACEDRGVIRLDYVRSDDAWHATTGLKELMQGKAQTRTDVSVVVVQLDLASGRARQELLPHVSEFPRVDPRVVGRRYSQVLLAERVDARAGRPGFDSVLRLDVTSGKADRYRYGADVMVEEHVFVPGTRAGEAWVIGTALDLKHRSMLLSVFDARRLADGPVAQAVMDRPMPLGFHGILVPNT
ncbi:carotenoid oxygenase [Ramlibacter sp. G-1-2-2]|uniref:Carotenoid oxygenase n=1 Tax=Ramlibacter agri TaxID=2728837 RepID=A0A848H067_9BURK|nr:carotenoid oxygenase family protein [Ramlibacter agri]NML44346.1 carotenoid oxygenase [Ramlibacter agri]